MEFGATLKYGNLFLAFPEKQIFCQETQQTVYWNHGKHGHYTEKQKTPKIICLNTLYAADIGFNITFSN